MKKLIVGTPVTSVERWEEHCERFFPNVFEVVRINPAYKFPYADIVIFDGGADVSPSLYSEIPHYTTNTDMRRDEIETKIFHHYYGKACLAGICRGNQFLNVMLGGKLHQHLPELGKGHYPVHTTVKVNAVNINVPREFTTNSTHHQAVSIPGDNLIVTFRDKVHNVIEGTEDIDNFVRTVQFHPEYFQFPKTDIEVLSYLFFRDVFDTED